MTTDLRAPAGARTFNLINPIDRAFVLVRWIAPATIVQLVARLALAVPFWRSDILKWDGFLQINDTAVTLVSDEFMLHLPGGFYPFPVPALFALLSGSGEIIFPILLDLGLGTRFAALGLLLTTLTVDLTVPDCWPLHLTSAAMALGLIAWGRIARRLDGAVLRRWSSPRRGRHRTRSVTSGYDGDSSALPESADLE